MEGSRDENRQEAAPLLGLKARKEESVPSLSPTRAGVGQGAALLASHEGSSSSRCCAHAGRAWGKECFALNPPNNRTHFAF